MTCFGLKLSCILVIQVKRKWEAEGQELGLTFRRIVSHQRVALDDSNAQNQPEQGLADQAEGAPQRGSCREVGLFLGARVSEDPVRAGGHPGVGIGGHLDDFLDSRLGAQRLPGFSSAGACSDQTARDSARPPRTCDSAGAGFQAAKEDRATPAADPSGEGNKEFFSEIQVIQFFLA